MEREREARHGTRSAYVGGCHCAPCTAANARYERRRARRARGIGVSTTVLGAVSAGVEATLGTVSESDEHAALRALASALALELDSILASADHSPTHTASISAQLRATLAELSIGTNTRELEAFFTGEPPTVKAI